MDVSRLQRDLNLWFGDGTLIIQAEDTLFRVYGGMLARVSDVFRDLLELPQHPDAESMDGCPVVRLEGSTTEEIRAFLTYLYDPSQDRYPNSVGASLSLLQTCHKYLASGMERAVATSLRAMFPSDYNAFKDSQSSARTSIAPFDYTTLAHNVAVANTARTIGMLLLLPAALYRLCRLDQQDVARSALSAENLRAVLAGRARLSAVARTQVFPHIFAPEQPGTHASITRRDKCRIAKSERVKDLTGGDGWVDPLDTRKAEIGLCAGCKPSTRTLPLPDPRLKIWEELPE